MKKLKIVLLFSLVICIFISFKIQNESKYTNENYIVGYVNNYKIDGNKLTIELIGKEKIIANYYFETEQEKIDYETKLKLGVYLELKGTLETPGTNTNFNLFSYKNYLLSKKIYYVFKIDEIKIMDKYKKMYILKNLILNRMNKSQNKEYLKLFIIGENNLDDEINNSYQINGISHLFSISGMHVTLFTSFLFFVLNKINRSKKLNFLIIIIFLIIYIFLTNYSPSVLRSALFFIILNIKKILKIDITNLELLIFLLLILLIYNPYYIYNNGFVYSFSTSISLIIFGKVINKQKNYIFKTFITSLIAFLISMPISINSYFQVNLLGPFLNVLFVPLVSFVIFPLGLLNFIFPFLDPFYNLTLIILENTSLLCSQITFFNITLCKISFYIVILYYIVIVLSIKNFKYLLLILMMIIIHNNINIFKTYPAVTIIDVGQGDSILIELPHNKGNILIDTGGITTYYSEKWMERNNKYSIAKSTIIPYLKSIGIKRINYLILSHGDYDHMGEAINLVEDFKVEKVIFNCGDFNELEQDLIKVLDKKKIPYYSCINELSIDNNKLYFLQTKEYDNENDNSSVIYTKLNIHKFLFMGDAGIEKEKDILEKYDILNVDVLKVGHHGSKTSSSKSFINELNPKYSIISVGKNNRYSHPNDSVLDNLEDSKIFRTDLDGSIIFKIKNKKLQIETCAP